MADTDSRPSNFIRQIIDKDLASGKHSTVHTRFPPEPNGFCILVMPNQSC